MHTSMNPIHIARDGQALGRFADDDVAEGLMEGKFLPTDLAWRDPMPNWVPLSEFPDLPSVAVQNSGPAGQQGGPSDETHSQPKSTSEAPAVPVEPAWERRKEIGIATAAAETVSSVLGKPKQIFAAMPLDGGLLGPLTYSVLMGSLTGWVALGYQYVTARLNPDALGEDFRELFGDSMGLFFIALAVLTPVGVLVASFVTSALFHLCLKVLASKMVSFESTFRVYCYAWGSAAVFQLLPICGGYLYPAMAIYLTVLGLRDVQRVPTGVALLAVLLPFGFCCGSFIALAVGGSAAAGAVSLN